MQSSLSRPLFAATLLACACGAAFAQDGYPSRPITMIVPFAPGGANDAVARIVARAAEADLGTTIVIDNKGGAGGTIGTEQVARAKPDGYTLLLASAAHAINPLVYPEMRYDGIKDFSPIVQLTESPYVLVVGKSVTANSLQELLAQGRTASRPLTYASSGTGSAPHLAGALLGNMAKVPMEHVPYKGGGPAMIDVIRGDVAMYFASIPAAAPHFQSGAVRALAVSTASRVAALPDVPTVAEQGVPGYELAGWYAVLAPAKTPDAIVDRLNKAFNKALLDPAVKKQLATEGSTVAGGDPAKLATLIKDDTAKYAKMKDIIN